MLLILELAETGPACPAAEPRKVFSLLGGTIGRNESNDWVLPDPHLSGRHAVVRSVGGRYFLVDQGSSNGVAVNGTMLYPGELYPLESGDVIHLDRLAILVRTVEEHR
jgi:pSer/pThr/pTyr-binding forkhead associated (FHA) protein